jgi:phosphopantothenoylcysteine decarboxylase/phosphopantothenate--cysteine ligase
MRTKLRILVTAGATREPLDSVRYISNLSTGSTGAALAAILAKHGHRVTLLRGQGSAEATDPGIEQELFSSASDLEDRLHARLRSEVFDAVIMCAAVADYRPQREIKGKIRSDAPSLTLKLVRNAKILPRLKSFSRTPLVVVGFKLTVGADRARRRKAVNAQFDSGGVDAVVQNDLKEILSARVHPFRLYRSDRKEPGIVVGHVRLVRVLEPLLGGA